MMILWICYIISSICICTHMDMLKSSISAQAVSTGLSHHMSSPTAGTARWVESPRHLQRHVQHEENMKLTEKCTLC